MAKTRHRRIRRNPPKMTPALRRKIGARIRALHRSGKYRKSVRRSSSRRRVLALSASRPASVTRRAPRRVSRRRTASRSAGRALMGGGMLGLRSVLNRDNLMMAGGAVAAAFVVQWSHGQILKMVATKDAAGKATIPANSVWLNPFVTAAIKLGITAVAAKVTSRWNRPVATGMLIGGTVVVINDAIAALVRPKVAATTSSGTAQYLSQYLGAAPTPGRNVRSLVGPVTPTAATFGTGRVGMNALYGNTAAFSGDAWSRR